MVQPAGSVIQRHERHTIAATRLHGANRNNQARDHHRALTRWLQRGDGAVQEHGRWVRRRDIVHRAVGAKEGRFAREARRPLWDAAGRARDDRREVQYGRAAGRLRPAREIS